MKNNMLNRFATGAALFLMTLPLTACGSSGDDDSNGQNTPSWSGHTYLLSLQQGDWATPRGIGMDLFGVAPAFVFDVEGSGANTTATLGYGPGTMLDSTMTSVAVTTDNFAQDSCGLTTELPLSAADYPQSTLSEPHMTMHVVNAGVTPPLQVTADVYNLKFTNVLPNGSTPATMGTLEATMDFKQLYVLFQSLGPTRTADSVCQALSEHYTPHSCPAGDATCTVACEPCPNAAAGDAPTCLTVTADHIGAVQADNIKVNTVTTVDPTACANSTLPQ